MKMRFALWIIFILTANLAAAKPMAQAASAAHAGQRPGGTDLWSPRLDVALGQGRDWVVSHPAPDRVLLVNKDHKQSLLIAEYRSTVPLAESERYLQGQYAQQVILTRSKQVKFRDMRIKNAVAQTGIYRARSYGQFTFDLDVPEGIATFNERLWPAQGRLWQVTMVDYGAAISAPQTEKISEIMASVMDATMGHAASASWLNFILPNAYAGEVINGQPARAQSDSTKHASPPDAAPEANSAAGAAKCEAYGFDRAIRGQGAPSLKVNSSSVSGCIAGAGDAFPKMLESTKKAFASGLEDLTQKTAANLERHPCAEPEHPSGIAGWITYSAEIENYNNCLQMAGTTAVIQKAGDIVGQTASGVTSLAQWVWTTKDPVGVIAAIMANKIDGFGCLNAETQSKMFCEFVAKATVTTVSAVATSGLSAAGAAALSGAKGVVILEEGLRAAKAAMLLPKAGRKAGEASMLANNAGSEAARELVKDARPETAAEAARASETVPAPAAPPAPADDFPGFAVINKRLAANDARRKAAREAAEDNQAKRISEQVGHDDPRVATAISENRSVGVSQVIYRPLKPLDGREIQSVETKLKSSKLLNPKGAGMGDNGAMIVTLEDGSKAIWKQHSEVWSSNYRGEVLAYELDRKFGFGLVPATVERRIDGKVGSLQLFKESKRNLTPETSEIRKQKLLDFVIDNRDRHESNYLTDADAKVVSIDHGLTFTGKGNHGTTFFQKRADLDRFLVTDEGKQIIAKMKSSVGDGNFETEVKEYLGKPDADRLIKRIRFIVDYSEKLGAK